MPGIIVRNTGTYIIKTPRSQPRGGGGGGHQNAPPTHRLASYHLSIQPPNLNLRQPPRLGSIIQTAQLRTLVLPDPMHQPPEAGQADDTHQDNAVVVHARDGRRQRVGEAVHEVEEGDEEDGEAVDDVAGLAHVEGARGHVLAAREHVGQEAQGVGGRGEDDEGTREVGEGGLGAERDGAEGVGEEAGEQRRGDGAREGLVDAAEEVREGGCVVAREGPVGAADGEEGADEAGGEGEEDDEEEAEGRAVGAGCLGVGFGEGEGAGAVLDGGDVADAVEEGDGEAEGVDGAEAELGGDGAGQVAFWVGQFFRHVGYRVRGADGEGAVQDAGQEGDAGGPAGGVVPVCPDEGVGGVFLGHRGQHDDGHDAADGDDEKAALLEDGQEAVEEDCDGDADPGD